VARGEKALDRLHHISTHNLLGFLEKLSREAIRARGSIITHTEKGSFNLFRRDLSDKPSPLVLVQTFVNKRGNITRVERGDTNALPKELMIVGYQDICHLL